MALHLLAIGNNYRGTLNELPDCELDAQNISELFAPYCESVTTLLSKGRESIVKATTKFLSKLGKNDLGILYYSGHGTQTAVNMKISEAIVCNDVRLIYDFELRSLLNERAKGSMLAMAADCCYSGGLSRGIQGAKRMIPASRCIKHRIERPARMPKGPEALYTAAGKEPSYSTGQGGAWTLEFMDAFADRKAKTTLPALHKQIIKHLPSDEWPQHPTFECANALAGRTLKSFVPK